jgi:hypothetical protein
MRLGALAPPCNVKFRAVFEAYEGCAGQPAQFGRANHGEGCFVSLTPVCARPTHARSSTPSSRAV